MMPLDYSATTPAATSPGASQPQEPAVPVSQGPLGRFWDHERGELDLVRLATALEVRNASHAELTERMQGVPARSVDYVIEPILPEGIEMPEGTAFKFDDEAVVAQAAHVAHQAGVPQQAFSQLLGLYAAHQIKVAQEQRGAFGTWLVTENAKLGESGPVRRDAIETYLHSEKVAPDEAAEVRLCLATEAGVRLLERLITNAGGGRQGKGPAAAAKPSSMADRWYSGGNR